jgi:hypothetical protein
LTVTLKKISFTTCTSSEYVPIEVWVVVAVVDNKRGGPSIGNKRETGSKSLNINLCLVGKRYGYVIGVGWDQLYLRSDQPWRASTSGEFERIRTLSNEGYPAISRRGKAGRAVNDLSLS